MPDPNRPWHVLAVESAAVTSLYFQEKCGFEEFRAVGENDWRFLRRNDCFLMLGTCAGETPAGETGNHSYFAYWHADDVDALHQEWLEKGALIDARPVSKPWGMREFGLRTPDGHRIVVGQEIK